MSDAVLTFANNRYRLKSELGHGGMSAIYIAYDRLSGQEVALKQIYIRRTNRTDASISTETTEKRLVLAQEFRTLATLRHPNIINVIDYGFSTDGQPFYVMELLRHARPLTTAANDQPTAVKLDLLIQVMNALVYLHRRGILHRDLKPANILVVNDVVKVLDFGLAIESEALSSQTPELVGTLQYIAPEVFLGGSPSIASDLYAVGVIAYEMFLGRTPFNTADIRAVLNSPVSVDLPGEDSRLAKLITNLLSKRPEQRPRDSSAVLETLLTIANRSDVREDISLRESFIQAARFVGRAAELAKLREALKDTLRGAGSFWLIGGESGVGKSRLMDEIRTFGLIEGALVIRGQAINAGGSPYALFAEIVRRLALNLEADQLPLSVLKTLVPDIGTLFKQEIPDPPPVEPQTALNRLIKAVTDLFLAQTQPILVLLEDLQWAGDSLALLDGLAKLIDQHHMLFIGSYRIDEAPALPERFPTAHTITLTRLNPTEIDQLTVAVMGDHPAQGRVAELLERETDGNLFFIVEVLRLLAEEAGQLDRIGVQTLPPRVFTGGIVNLVRHRLENLPPGTLPLLRLAAVLGRELQPNVLAQGLKLLPDMAAMNLNLDLWLSECISRMVLALQDERILFAHDKLREVTLDEIPTTDLPKLHEIAALALEAEYGDSANAYAALAYHWGAAGNPEKELHYAARAGEFNVNTGAYAQAISFLTRVDILEQARKDIDPAIRAKHLRMLGQAYFYTGQIEHARGILYQAVRNATRPIPNDGILLKLDTIAQMTTQMSRRMLKRKPRARHTHRTEALIESGRSLFLLGEMSVYTSDVSKGAYIGMRAINESESAGPSDALVRHFAGLSWVLSLNPRMRSMVRQYMDLGLEVAAQAKDDSAASFAEFIYALLSLGWAEWDACREHGEKSAKLAEASGDLRTWVSVLGVLGDLAFWHDGDSEKALEMQSADYSLALKMGSVNQMAFTQSRRAYIEALMGDWERAVEDANAALALEKPQNLTAMNAYAALTLKALYDDQYPAVVSEATTLLNTIEATKSLNVYGMVDGCAVAADAWLTLAELDSAYLPQARRALAQLTRAAETYVTAEPRLQTASAWLAHLEKRPDDALKAAHTAFDRAGALHMPYEEGMAAWMLARLTPGSSSNPLESSVSSTSLRRRTRTNAATRADYHDLAIKRFSRLLFAYDLRRALRSTGGDHVTDSTKPG
ncbi:MAG: protein kinase [Anaerolineae bacterium]